VSDNIHLLAGAYALDALTIDERAFYERHLSVCEACRFEVAEYAEVAAELGIAAAATPPAGLRARVLTEVEQTRQVSATPGGPASLSRRVQRVLTPVAAVLVALVIGLSGAVAVLWQDNQQLESAVAGERVLAELVATGRSVPMTGPSGVPATFVFDLDRDEGVLVATGLSAPAQGMTYQLWVFRDGQPVDAGVFGSDGHFATATASESLHDAEQVAVTMEPAGGVDQPTGEVLLVGEF
jgi:anti-sigma-K factor RskA